MGRLKIAVIGAGAFGNNHVRILSKMAKVEFTGVFDTDPQKAMNTAVEHGVAVFNSLDEAKQGAQAAVVATPTISHEQMASELLRSGIHVLVEKPIADSSEAGRRLTRLAQEAGCVLQVGHLERFNPAVMALKKAVTFPLFFEVHRMSVFTPRSLDIDVVRDLMIHDLDIVLDLTANYPDEIRAAGISVLSDKVDIANVRLSFANGCIANLTASRVSTERVRKLRLFQPHEYLSLDYQRQDVARVAVNGQGRIGFEQLAVEKCEPLMAELEAFVEAVNSRTKPAVDGAQASSALQLAEQISAKIEEHSIVVNESLGNLARSSNVVNNQP